MKRLAAGVCLLLLATAPTAQAQQRPCGSKTPINTLADLTPALYACWRPPAGTEGREITLRFSVRRDGSLLGKPRATYSKMTDRGADDRAFVASVLKALDEAVPLPLTESFGGVIAGRPMAVRFVSTAASQGI